MIAPSGGVPGETWMEDSEGIEREPLPEPAAGLSGVASVLDGLPSPVFLKDEHHRLVFVNAAFCELMGRGRNELVGRSHADFVPPEEAQAFAAKDDEVLARGGVEENEEHLIDAAGQRHTILTRKTLHTDARGRPLLLGVISDITDLRRLGEERLRSDEARWDSERRLRLHVDLTPVAVLEYDREFRVTAWNPAAESIFGWSAREALGRHASFIVAESAQARVREVFRQLRTGANAAKRSTNENVTRDGRTIVCDWNNTSLVSSSGEFIGVASMAMDITERTRALASLAEREGRLQAILRTALDGYYTVTAEGALVEVNDAYCEMSGYRREELLRMRLSDLEAAEGPAEIAARVERLKRSGGERFETRHRRKDGRVIDIEASVRFLAEGGGSFVCFARDVTGRKRAADALRQSEERFRALIEKSSDMIMVLDADSRFRFWSQGAVDALGWTLEERLGRPALELVHEGDRQRMEQALERVLSQPSVVSRDLLRHRHKDGTWRELEATARNLLEDPAVRGVVLNTRDVTEQRQLEEQFRQAQKLESIGRLAGGVAHDFNNLLTVILSSAEALKEGFPVGSSTPLELADEIHAAGQRAAQLTRQLLAFSRKQAIAPAPVDLNEVVRGIETLLRRVLGEDVALVVRLEPATSVVRCDRNQVEQAILNLAINSRDAMPGGGTLTLEAANVQVDERLVAAHPFMRAGPYCRLTVSDSGVGMGPEVKAHVFEPFFTTKPQGKGTGLGLATVYGIVKQAGGFILLSRSEVGRGTSFDLYFPLTAEPAPPAEEPPSRSVQGTETILVVEDDPQVRTVTVRSLASGGYQVRVASCGLEALEVASRHAGPLELLLTDVIMPGLNGRALADELRRRRPGLRVLYMSGYPQEVVSQARVLDSGAEVLPKPFTAATLLQAVRRVLDRRPG